MTARYFDGTKSRENLWLPFLLVSLMLMGLCITAKVMLSQGDGQCSAKWGEQKITKWRESQS